MKDLFGKAILDFQTNNSPDDLITATSISEPEVMPVSYLFRSFDEMPALERQALQMSYGKILDIGCGAGSHSLWLEEEKNLNVLSIDISPNAIAACRLRGLENAKVADVMNLNAEKFDTILLLMNGAGMCGTLQNINPFLQKLKSLLGENGQILLDSSDIIYMFDEDENGDKLLPDCGYYGEVTFFVSYKGKKETPFRWIYIDFKTLKNAAAANGLQCDLVLDGEHYDYLAKLSIA